MIPKETIRNVAQTSDIVGYIGSFVKLKKNGKNFLGLCPFHQEKTPSFFVTPQKNVYKCFGCNAYGNIISFAMNYENLPFIDAVKKIAVYSGIAIVEENYKKKEENSIETQCYEDTLDFFCENLKKCSADSPVGKLIENRKLSAYILDKYNIGYAPDKWDSLNNYLTAKKYPQELLLKHSLIKKSENNRVYDFYRNRLIFPIRSMFGSIAGFGARAIGEEMPKYINPAETPVYSKSNILYGLHEATPSIRKNSRIIITEGYIDVLRMAQEGFDEAVALCGTALTDGHVRIFKHFQNPKVIIMPDGDSAGLNSALKSARLLMMNNLPGYISMLESGVDPGDFFDLHPAEKMRGIIEQSVESPYFIVSRSKSGGANTDSNARIKSLGELVEFSTKIPPVSRDYFLDITSEVYGVKRPQLEKIQNAQQNKTDAPLIGMLSDTEQSSSNKLYFAKIKELYPRDFNIVESLLTGHIPLEGLEAIYPPDMFQDSYLKSFYRRILQLDHNDLLHLDDEELRNCFPEYKHLIDFINIFSDSNLKSEPAHNLNQIILELMRKNLFEYFRIKSKVMDYQNKKAAYITFQDQIRQLVELLTPGNETADSDAKQNQNQNSVSPLRQLVELLTPGNETADSDAKQNQNQNSVSP